MTAEQQNENWLRMASDSRKEVRRIYSLDHNGREFDKGFEYAIETIFGKHNLTSDIEPKEMLLVERKRVNEIYSEAEMNNKYYSQPNCNERERIIKVYFGGQMVALKQLFGDKCLNEKETLFSENHKNENKENGIVGSENKPLKFGDELCVCNGFDNDLVSDGDKVVVLSFNQGQNTYDVAIDNNVTTISANYLKETKHEIKELIVKKQDWSNYNRYFIVHEYDGSVCLDLYPEKQESFGGTAYIWNLFVSKESRHKGIGKMLLDKAERLARQSGHKAVVMEWELGNTPREILDWYLRSGYEVVGHYREVQYTLEKKL